MQTSTIIKLNQLNQQFYRSQARSFSQTRQAPWLGWTQLIPFIQKVTSDPLKVLDIGCGNGRFGQFLANSVDRSIEYTGTDNSEELLKIARENNPNTAGKTFTFIYQDLIEELLNGQLFAQSISRYDLIVIIAVLHHIPSIELRQKLLSTLSNLLNSNGLLVFTVWRFGELGRFQNKLVNPEDYNVNPTELEQGDYLVDWLKNSARQTATDQSQVFPSVRYAHAISDQELSTLTADLPPIIHSYLADGHNHQTNRYLLIEKLAK